MNLQNVSRINYLAVFMATVAALMVSSVWYSPLLFGKHFMELSGMDPTGMAETTMPAGTILGELVRSLILAFVLAHLVVRLGIADWRGLAQLGIWP